MRRPFQQLKAVLVRQVHIADDDFEWEFGHSFNCLLAGRSRFCSMTEATQIVGHGFEDVMIVVDHQQ